MRDDFPQLAKETLAKRVGVKCSNPSCAKVTSGPQEDATKAINIGVAAHITAAAPGGPRYDANLNSEQRSSIENGIWLCQNCAKLIDNDAAHYSVDEIRAWKLVSESQARRMLESSEPMLGSAVNYARLEKIMPELLSEMRTDMKGKPFVRNFILKEKGWIYNGDGTPLFQYFYEDHPNLNNLVQILENYNLLYDDSRGNTKRYIFTEEFASYLSGI